MQRVRWLVLLLALALGVELAAAAAPTGIRLQQVSTGRAALAAARTTWGNGRYVQVGYGQFRTSIDGQTWQPVSLPIALDQIELEAVTWTGALFVAVGRSGTYENERGVIFTSPDGLRWSSQSGKEWGPLTGVAGRPDRIVAVGKRALLVSTDGLSWQQVPIEGPLQTVATDGKRFLASSPWYFYQSADGLQWWKASGINPPWLLAWGDGRWMAANGNRLYSSTDGQTWVEAVVPDQGRLREFVALDWVRDRFVAYAPRQWSMEFGQERPTREDGRMAGAELTSLDGQNWQVTEIPRQDLHGVAWGNGQFVAVGQDGRIRRSTDGRSWSTLQAPTMAHLYAVTWASGRFLAVGEAGTILTSSDGQSWTTVNSGTTGDLTQLCAGPKGWLAAGPAGIRFAADGVRWQPSSGASPARITCRTDGTFESISADSHYLSRSTDGLTWSTGAVAERGPAALTADGAFWIDGNALGGPTLGKRLYQDGSGLGGLIPMGKGVLAGSGGSFVWLPLTPHAATVGLGDLPAGANAGVVGANRLVLVGNGDLIQTAELPVLERCVPAFPDLSPVHSTCPAVGQAAAEGWLNGQPDGTVRPDRPITRAEWAKLYLANLGLTGLSVLPPAARAFPDLKGHWGAPWLAAAVQAGVMQGTPEGKIWPDRQITVAEGVKMVVQADYPFHGFLPSPGAHWATEYMKQASRLGLSMANGAPRLDRPDQLMTRGEAIGLLANMRLVRRGLSFYDPSYRFQID